MPPETVEPSHSKPHLGEKVVPQKLLVVVPCFQEAKIGGCIDSIRRHTNSARTSILVVDDSSTREFSKFLHHLSDVCGFTLVTNDENRGPAFCRNIGIRYAIRNNFDHITFVDSDDQLVADITCVDYNSFDLTIYNSFELSEKAYGKKLSIELLPSSDFSLNDCHFNDIPEALAAYLHKPNRVPTFSMCWAKVFSVRVIASAQSSLLFDERMRTFEDVDFVIRYLLFARSVSFNRSGVYGHTRYQHPKGATFGKDFNSLFSFLQMARSVRLLLKKYNMSSRGSLHHFIAAYYSISIIRCAIKVNGLSSLVKFCQFIERRVRSPFVQVAFASYSPARAGGRVLIKTLIRFRLSLVLSACAVFWAYRRYRSSSF